MSRSAIIYISFIFVIPLPVFAYLDPGSGSMLFSAVIGIVATVFFVMKGLFYKIIDLPAHLKGIRGKKSSHSIVFYSEGAQYWNVFMPVIRELSGRGVKCTYLSSRQNDPGLNCGFEHVETKFIGEGNRSLFYLNTLIADVCVMTTPGLDVLQIKRSPGVKKYVHITHSSGGVSGYSTFGLDYYDTVLTGGEGDKEFIETIENVRDLTKKNIVPIGCTYLDVMREKSGSGDLSHIENNVRKTIIISPTWGSHGLLSKYGEKLLGQLTRCNKFNIIVRPHPQSFVSEKSMLNKLKVVFPGSDHLKWDDMPDGFDAMRSSDIMISDFSGIVFDFIFLFRKPVLTFRAQYDRRGKDSMDYPGIPWNIRSLDLIGRSLDEGDVSQIDSIIDTVLESGINDDIFSTLRDGMDKYPMESGRRGADLIIKLTGEQE